MWMLIVDARTGLVPLNVAEQAEGGAVLLRSSWLLDALIMLFESLWERAVPLPEVLGGGELADVDGPGITEVDRKMLALMAAGLKDVAISRQLSIDPSTVRRRVGRLMRALDAKSRFQAGVQAARRGWL